MKQSSPTAATSWMPRLRTIARLTSGEWAALLTAAPLVAATRIGLWLLPGRVTIRLVERLGRPSRVAPSPRSPRAATIVWAVEAVGRRIPRATCLTQAIAGKLMLDAAGEQAELCLGVARAEDGALRAHAWLERDGRALLGGAGVQSLVRLPALPQSANVNAPLTR
ncbi:MAG TPA: lasso peptide biosynthesis B2 protein [Gemmatimonadaceae bacterium]|jgi:hypothetical protein